jgi:hypothetical protein
VDAIGRFTAQSPGCRQGTILAPMAVWQLLPGSRPFVPWDILDRRRYLRVAARSRVQRRGRRQGSGERLELNVSSNNDLSTYWSKRHHSSTTVTFHRYGGPRRRVSRRSCGTVRVGRLWSGFDRSFGQPARMRRSEVVASWLGRLRSGLELEQLRPSGSSGCGRAAPGGSNERRRLPRACHTPAATERSCRRLFESPGAQIVSTPDTQAISALAKQLVSRHQSQFPMARRPSLPRARMPWPCLSRAPPRALKASVGHSLTAVPDPRDPRPSPSQPAPALPNLWPPESQRSQAPHATVPRHLPPAAFAPAGPAPGQAPFTAPPGPPRADPNPGSRLRHRQRLRALANKSGSGLKRRNIQENLDAAKHCVFQRYVFHSLSTTFHVLCVLLPTCPPWCAP